MLLLRPLRISPEVHISLHLKHPEELISTVGEAFKVTKARALTKGKKPRRQLGSDKDGAPTKASEKHIRPKTICSVDFGTTYSGQSDKSFYAGSYLI